MTLAEIEVLLLQIKAQVEANTAAITTLNNTIKSYATTDDLTALTEQVKILTDNNDTLSDAVATVQNRIGKVDHLSTLLDVKVQSITVNDVLQYSSDGKWHNIQPHMLKLSAGASSGSGSTTLAALTDTHIVDVEDGQILVYSGADNKWLNSDPSTILI